MNTRHDEISNERQQKLAALLLLTNLFIGLASAGMMLKLGWDPELTVLELILLAVLVAISWINLLIASGFLGWAAELVPSLFSEGPHAAGGKRLDHGLLAKRRMVFYYTGVWSNLVVFALVVEVTGGLSESPFSALFIAFVLTGQQLSRFRTQSGTLFVSGLLVAVLMVLLEPLSTAPQAAAPHEFTIAMILLALTVGGLLNYFAKPHNYLVGKHVKPPSRARIYVDGVGNWRFALFQSIHRQDPLLLGREKAKDTADGIFPSELRERFDECVATMADSAGWNRLASSWPERYAASFTVTLDVDQDEQG